MRKKKCIKTNKDKKIIHIGKATIHIPNTNLNEFENIQYSNTIATIMMLASIVFFILTLIIAEMKPDIFGVDRGYIYLRIPGTMLAFASVAMTLLNIDKLHNIAHNRVYVIIYTLIALVISFLITTLLIKYNKDFGIGDFISLILLICSFIQLVNPKNPKK